MVRTGIAMAVENAMRYLTRVAVFHDSPEGVTMFFQIVLASLLIVLLGLGLCFGGYRFFTILLPIWGFFAGFQFGATIFTNLFGQGFLSTIISWVIGLLVGIFAAVLA